MTSMIQTEQNVRTENTQKNRDGNPFVIIRKFSRDFWEQTGEPLKYLGQLNSEIQSRISVYYTTIIPKTNSIIKAYNNLYLAQMKDCFNFEISKTDKQKNV